VIVCDFPEPVLWQTATFSRPRPRPFAAPVVAVVPAVVVVVLPTVDVVEPVVVVDVIVLVEVEVEVEVDVEVDVELEDVVVESVAAERVGEGPAVIWARPTPAAATNARPTIAPMMERRLNRLNRLSTGDPFVFGGFLRPSVAAEARNLRSAIS
jgi:hypothetical protein